MLVFLLTFWLVRLITGEEMDMDRDPLINKTLNMEYSDKVTWRIVGGRTASPGQFPYMASLRDASNRHFCGGSIINQRWILTAAHCMGGVYPANLRVLVGTNTLTSGGTRYNVDRITVHPYHNAYHKNDVALIHVTSPITFSQLVQPISLGQMKSESSTSCVLSGWGSLFLNSPTPNKLQYILLNCLGTSTCRQHLPEVDQSQLCTFTRQGQGACHGDSGGPLVSNGYLVGLVSYGTPCAKGLPDVYTRVSAFYNWVTQNIY